MKPIATIFASLITILSAQATVVVPPIFSDHAVLQQDAPVPVWGFAEAGEKVTVAIAGQSKTATTGADGRWQVELDKLQAGGPHELSITGSNAFTFKDILVGEVWLGSGQSNMAMTVNRAQDYEKEQAAANTPQIRMFTVGGTRSDKVEKLNQGKWVVCAPDTVGSFSATLYFTGREIYRELKVPMGLINSSVGGTPIDSWIDAKAQRSLPELAPLFAGKKDKPEDDEAAKARYQKELADWNAAVKKARAEGKQLPRRPRDPVDTKNRKADVGGLFNGKIAGLIGYRIRGALWYQGEANAQPEKSALYQYQLPLLVTDWRKRWGYDFPFGWVQLPNFSSRADAWCQVREAELKTTRLPDTGMAVTIDIGEEKNIHPKNKQEVGRRLSQWALGSVYGKAVAVSGPRFTGSEVKGSDVVVKFSHTDGGLTFKGEPQGFVLAGEDKQWHPATARIEGDTLVLSSMDVPAPKAARYAWADMPPCTLWNGAGLPASPFRTDDWALDYGVAAAAAAKAKAPATPRLLRVACVGDSITAGVGAKDRAKGPYPAQLQILLGKRYQVRNFGVSGSTLLSSGDKPYDKEPAFKNAVAFKPDIVILKLGTNDSKPQNWEHKDDFIPSAKALLSAFRTANPKVKVYLCLPIPAFPENFGITEKVISEGVIPELQKLAETEKLTVIDLHKAMQGQSQNVPDKVHPNDQGYRTMAAKIYEAMTGKEAMLDLLPSLSR